MAFTVTARQVLDHGALADAAQTGTTDSVTPTASSLLLVGSGAENNNAFVVPVIQTPTGGSLAYTNVAKVGEGTAIPWETQDQFCVSAALWRADIGGAPSAFAVTVDHLNTADTAMYCVIACDITGHASSTPVQSKTAGAAVNPASDTASASVTLDATPAVGSLVVLFATAGADTGGAYATPTAGVGKNFTAVVAQNNAGIHHAGMWYREWDGTESNTITVSDLGNSVGNYALIAVEIPAGGTPNTGSATGAFSFAGSASGTNQPATPANLQATVISDTEIDLSWDAVSGASGYDIERDGTVIVFDHATTSYNDTGLTAATQYDYRVRAVV